MARIEIGDGAIAYAKDQVQQTKKVACGGLPWERCLLRQAQDNPIDGDFGSKMVGNLLAIQNSGKETGRKHFMVIRGLLTFVYAAAFNAMNDQLPSIGGIDLLDLEAGYLNAENEDACIARITSDVRKGLCSFSQQWSDQFFSVLGKCLDLEWADQLFLLAHVRILLNKLEETAHRPDMGGIILLLQALNSDKSAREKEGQVRPPSPAAQPENSKIREPRVTFSDLGGYDQVKDQLLRLAKRVADPAAGKRWGSKPLKAVLLKGPKGTGKSAMAEAFAHEAGLKFMSLSIADTMGMYVNWSVSFLKSHFEEARDAGCVVLFFDEADAILGSRGQGSHREDDKVVNEFNIQVDRLTREDRVVVVLASNFAENLDGAAIRDKRVDMVIEMGLPDDHERRDIFRTIMRRVELAVGMSVFVPNIVLDELVRHTKGLPGASLENIIDRALWDKENQELSGLHPGLVDDQDLALAWLKRSLERPEGKGRIGFHAPAAPEQIPDVRDPEFIDLGGLETLLEDPS